MLLDVEDAVSECLDGYDDRDEGDVSVLRDLLSIGWCAGEHKIDKTSWLLQASSR